VTGHATLASILGRGHVTRLHQSTAAHLVQGRRLKATFATFFHVNSPCITCIAIIALFRVLCRRFYTLHKHNKCYRVAYLTLAVVFDFMN